MKILMRDDKNKKWEPVESNAYGAETELQELLANSPDVISMEEIRPGSGSLVAAVREFNLPVGYIDILAFTANGDIAVIECKLARNTQSKREVIGQILDYAAHLWGMSYEELDQSVHTMINRSLADLVHEKVSDPDWDEEEFRKNITQALVTGNFILTIAVNEINEELNRIVRYVNSAGVPAFSFAALEMRRFHNAKVEMLVPHVFGPSHTAVKPVQATKKWDEKSLFDALHQKDPVAETVAKHIFTWAKRRTTTIWWGEGAVIGSFVPTYTHNGRNHPLFAVYTNGVVETYFYWYQSKPPFESEESRLEILQRLNAIEGVAIPADGIRRRPSIKLSLLQSQKTLDQFLAVFDWMIEEIKKT